MYAIAHHAKLGKSDRMSEMREAINEIIQASYTIMVSRALCDSSLAGD